MKKSQSEDKIGFQYHLFHSPFPLRRVLEDFKSDYITLDETIIQINEISMEDKIPEEENLKYKTSQYRFNI